MPGIEHKNIQQNSLEDYQGIWYHKRATPESACLSMVSMCSIVNYCNIYSSIAEYKETVVWFVFFVVKVKLNPPSTLLVVS